MLHIMKILSLVAILAVHPTASMAAEAGKWGGFYDGPHFLGAYVKGDGASIVVRCANAEFAVMVTLDSPIAGAASVVISADGQKGTGLAQQGTPRLYGVGDSPSLNLARQLMRAGDKIAASFRDASGRVVASKVFGTAGSSAEIKKIIDAC